MKPLFSVVAGPVGVDEPGIGPAVMIGLMAVYWKDHDIFLPVFSGIVIGNQGRDENAVLEFCPR
jgi:hypothetical protein